MTRLLAVLMGALSWALAALGYRRAIALGRMLGSFVFHVLRIRRRVVMENLAGAFPDLDEVQRRHIARDCYRHLGRVLVEILILSRLSDEQMRGIVRWVGVEKLQQAMAEGTGAIMCLAHLGNWEMLGFACAEKRLPINAITKKLSGAVNELLHANRKLAFKELPPKNSFDRGVDVIRRNEILVLIIDQHMPGDRAVVVDFLGRPAASTPSAALFSFRSGAPVFASWMTVDENDNYVIEVRGPFEVPPHAELSKRLHAHTQRLADDLGEAIRAHPAQWFWVHRRWKVKAPAAGKNPESAVRAA